MLIIVTGAIERGFRCYFCTKTTTNTAGNIQPKWRIKTLITQKLRNILAYSAKRMYLCNRLMTDISK